MRERGHCIELTHPLLHGLREIVRQQRQVESPVCCSLKRIRPRGGLPAALPRFDGGAQDGEAYVKRRQDTGNIDDKADAGITFSKVRHGVIAFASRSARPASAKLLASELPAAS